MAAPVVSPAATTEAGSSETESSNSDASEARGAEGASAIDARIQEERKAEGSRFAIIPHKPNYLLPLTYNSSPNEDLDELDELEVKFQLSLKVPLMRGVIGEDSILSVGYTQQSYWQAYNHKISAAFRETVYEPEVMLSFVHDIGLWGFESRVVTLGFVHQSNGRNVPYSRSWNRVYANFVFERRNLYFAFRPWYRIPEKEKDDPLDTRGDDNPDIEDYAGRGDFTLLYLAGSHHFGTQIKHNMRWEHSRGGVELDYSFPLYKNLRGYLQWYNGYGESLIDYDQYVNRVGFGVMISDWL